MAKGPTLPDRPKLEVTSEMNDNERLAALEEHYLDVAQQNVDLSAKLEQLKDQQNELESRAADLAEENRALKSAPTYIATIEDILEDDAVIRQHGSNQEVLVTLPDELVDDVQAGDRVAVSESFAIETQLETQMDARAQAMEVEEKPSVTYDDIGGLTDQIRDVRETVEMPLDAPEAFESVGIDPPSGVLLYGPPGTGKTMLARAVAHQTDATFIRMAGSELVRKFIGEGSRLVRDLFELADERSPSVVFIDELDAIASKRTESKTAGDAEVQRTMMQLLSEMDGFDDRGDIYLIGATNRFDMLDRAILRPGRFDRLIEVPKPDVEARRAILEIHTREMSVADDLDFDELAETTAGASGAEIKAICTEAGMFAIRDDRTTIRMQDFLDAEKKIRSDEAVGKPVTPYVY